MVTIILTLEIQRGEVRLPRSFSAPFPPISNLQDDIRLVMLLKS